MGSQRVGHDCFSLSHALFCMVIKLLLFLPCHLDKKAIRMLIGKKWISFFFFFFLLSLSQRVTNTQSLQSYILSASCLCWVKYLRSVPSASWCSLLIFIQTMWAAIEDQDNELSRPQPHLCSHPLFTWTPTRVYVRSRHPSSPPWLGHLQHSSFHSCVQLF